MVCWQELEVGFLKVKCLVTWSLTLCANPPASSSEMCTPLAHHSLETVAVTFLMCCVIVELLKLLDLI